MWAEMLRDSSPLKKKKNSIKYRVTGFLYFTDGVEDLGSLGSISFGKDGIKPAKQYLWTYILRVRSYYLVKYFLVQQYINKFVLLYFT